ncbi:MAG TPA: non-homologous end-joining DNA ligase [Candidatus Acidoferrales bacterium]|nr:non-homologous end-joining DNA ligase [Candidatus Acidoferrales bacterium]
MPRTLETYKKKRDFAATPEPSGTRGRAGKHLRFVVQKHRATRLHYDFRLEADGVMPSWAVPKGPTLVAGERRLAMHVEDHPLDYRTFEGVIPKGQYGAGEVIVWDQGWYTLAEGTDPAKEIAKGKIKFILHGKKLKGMFSLVRIKPKEGEHGDPWLLIKDHDDEERKSYDIDKFPESVKTGKKIEDYREKSAKRAAAARDPIPKLKSVMLATLIGAPFDDDDWLFEIKWDGYRAICTVDAARKLTLVSRNGLNLLDRFPDLSALADAFSRVPIVVDGEICSLDARGRSDFQRLQDYAEHGHPLTYVAFDAIYAEGRDLRKTPIEERKELLERAIEDDALVLYSKHIIGKGKKLFEQARRNHLEGIIGKKRGSSYEERRSKNWVKIKAQHEQEFVIGGWTAPRGSRKGFGALLLGAYVKGKLQYVGSVGTGFSVKTLAEISKQLRALARETSPFVNDVDANATPHWVKPHLVCEIRFAELTRDLLLRQPAFLGLRGDKNARDVTIELPKSRG